MCVQPVAVAELCSISKGTRARARAATRTPSISGHALATLYVFRWNRLGRKGQTCKVTARGAMNSCRVEFEDGFRMVTSRNAIMKAK